MYERELATATAALVKAATIARSRFRTVLELTAKDLVGDIVTDVDLHCEKEIVKIIRSEYPSHAIIVEESEGYDTSSRWTWVVDPLDGTNNYAYAFPVYGASIALCYDDEPVVACIVEGVDGSIISAVKGSGIAVDGKPFEPAARVAPKPSAALWLGYDVDRGGATALSLSTLLTQATYRTFQNWAPTVDVGLFIRGAIDVIVGYKCAGTELPAVLLVLREAGARISGVGLTGRVSLTRPPQLFVAGRGGVVDNLLARFDTFGRRDW
jgi:myo-inositol-1(or 4)-monophosphatase